MFAGYLLHKALVTKHENERTKTYERSGVITRVVLNKEVALCMALQERVFSCRGARWSAQHLRFLQGR